MSDEVTIPPRIALTGGIGSGKSYVCACLARRGIEVYDCDAAAKRLMRTSESLKEQLSALVGPHVYVGDRLEKAVMARFMMQSEAHTAQVNAIVHPAVARDFLASGLRWMECAILFESGFDKYVDRVVCVTAPLETRISRVMRRDGIPRERVLEWMAKQWPQDEVLRRSHYEVVNDGCRDVDAQVEQLLRRL